MITGTDPEINQEGGWLRFQVHIHHILILSTTVASYIRTTFSYSYTDLYLGRI